MKNLMKFLSIAFAMFVYSCEEQVKTEDPNEPVEVTFVLNNPSLTDPATIVQQPTMLKSGGTLKAGGDENIPTCRDGEPTTVLIEGTKPDGSIIATQLSVLTDFEDGNQTVLLKLEPGTYTISRFDVLDENTMIIYASPQEGSYYDNLFEFTNNTEFTFTVEPFIKNKVDIDVLCWQDFAYEEFGYTWFQYNPYSINTLCFFSDVCTKFYDSWHQDLEGNPYINQAYDGYDFVGLFGVIVYNNEDIDHPVYANNKADGKPVCIEYLDNLLIPNETYSAELWLYLPDGDSTLLETIAFTDADFSDNGDNVEDVSTWGGDDGIWEFAIGDCAMAAQQEDINAVYNLPWMPLPNNIIFKLVNTQPQGYFALGNIQPDVEIGEFVTGDTIVSWCGAEDITISWNHTYKANVYPYYNIPAGTYLENVTDEQWAKLNWMANEVIPSTVSGNTQMLTIQNAIWEILGQPNNGSGASLLSGAPTSYIPPLGGFVIVIVDPYQDITNDLKCERQYQIAIMRFDP